MGDLGTGDFETEKEAEVRIGDGFARDFPLSFVSFVRSVSTTSPKSDVASGLFIDVVDVMETADATERV